MIAQLSGIDWNNEKLQKYRVGQLLIQVLQVLRHFRHGLNDALEFGTDRPEEVFRHAALDERQIARIEQAQGHVERLLRVVIRLGGVARRHVVVGLDQVDERLLPL